MAYMELFDKRFVRFMWDDELEGMGGFFADNIGTLKEQINNGVAEYLHNTKSRYEDKPFANCNSAYRFFYYDPNYEVKKAFNEGKKVQHLDGLWIDDDEPIWIEGLEYRIKPEEEKKWIAYLARQKNGLCFLDACHEDDWESAQENYRAKAKLFIGSESEVTEWYNARQKFAEAIKAWEDGKTIQVYEPLFKKWSDCAGTLEWYTECEYRVKPEEKTVVAKRCSNCVHEHCSATKEPCVSCKPEDSKYEARLCETCEYLGYSDDSEPCSSCSDENGYPNWKPVKKWRPYESSAEMIYDFIARFKVNCPSYCEPLIWVKGKENDNRFLVTGFSPEVGVCLDKAACSNFNTLFNWYTYLDGSPVGMEVKE